MSLIVYCRPNNVMWFNIATRVTQAKLSHSDKTSRVHRLMGNEKLGMYSPTEMQSHKPLGVKGKKKYGKHFK